MKKTRTMLQTTIAYHPGEFLGEELEARNRTQGYFADLIGVGRPFINELIKGKKNVTPRLAELFYSALGISAETWMNLQRGYDLFMLKKDKELQERKRIIERKLELA